MERLTKRETTEVNGKELVLCNHEESDCNDSCMYGYYCKWQKKANMRLKHYEDLEEQGKLIELPCNDGDTVYELCKFDDEVYGIYPMVVKSLVPFGQMKKNENGSIYVWNIYAESDYTYMYKSFYDFGKTVFLTEQEAKEELERLKNERIHRS